MSMTQEAEYRRAEAALPLPDLVNRAQTLSRMLDKGHRPYSHNQLTSQPDSRLGQVALPPDGLMGVQIFSDEAVRMSSAVPHSGRLSLSPQRRNRSEEVKDPAWNASQTSPESSAPLRTLARPLALLRQHKLCVGIALLAIVIIVVVVAVSVTVTRKHRQPKCSGNLTGSSCTLGEFINFVYVLADLDAFNRRHLRMHRGEQWTV